MSKDGLRELSVPDEEKIYRDKGSLEKGFSNKRLSLNRPVKEADFNGDLSDYGHLCLGKLFQKALSLQQCGLIQDENFFFRVVGEGTRGIFRKSLKIFWVSSLSPLWFSRQ